MGLEERFHDSGCDCTKMSLYAKKEMFWETSEHCDYRTVVSFRVASLMAGLKGCLCTLFCSVFNSRAEKQVSAPKKPTRTNTHRSSKVAVLFSISEAAVLHRSNVYQHDCAWVTGTVYMREVLSSRTIMSLNKVWQNYFSKWPSVETDLLQSASVGTYKVGWKWAKETCCSLVLELEWSNVKVNRYGMK